jgi:hypothetical protein
MITLKYQVVITETTNAVWASVPDLLCLVYGACAADALVAVTRRAAETLQAQNPPPVPARLSLAEIELPAPLCQPPV